MQPVIPLATPVPQPGLAQGAVRIGVMGKHPGFGDFVRAGVSDHVADGLDAWASATLQTVRTDLGDGWEPFWDSAQTLRFWMGRALFGRTLAGVVRPSRDKVGRRYPLFLLIEGAAISPPMIAPDPWLFDALEAHLNSVLPGPGASSLLIGTDQLVAAFSPEDPENSSILWAHRADGDLASLLADAAGVDHAQAAQGRSYWWAPPRHAPGNAVWLGMDGLPAAPSLGWLLAGGPAAAAAPIPMAPSGPEADHARD